MSLFQNEVMKYLPCVVFGDYADWITAVLDLKLAVVHLSVGVRLRGSLFCRRHMNTINHVQFGSWDRGFRISSGSTGGFGVWRCS